MSETLTVHSGDAELHVRTAGGEAEGNETLVCLHGGPGLSHDYMAGLFDLASPDLQVVLYDQRGVGRSTGSIDEDLLSWHVADLEAVQSAVGAHRVHLLGHSWGGLVIALAAQQKAEAIASAVFLDSAPTTRSALDAAQGRFEQRSADLVGSGAITPPADGSDGTAWVRALLPAYFHDPSHPQAHDHGGVTLNSEVFAATMEALGDYDLSSALAALSAPSLAIASPVPFGTEMGLSVTTALPASRSVILSDCGHLSWLEAPDQLFPTLRSFFDEVGP